MHYQIFKVRCSLLLTREDDSKVLKVFHMVAVAYTGLILGRCGFRKKMGVREVTPSKLITFYPFVNGIIVIFVNFLDFVIFSLLFSRLFSYWLFLGGEGCAAPPRTPLYTRLYGRFLIKQVTQQ